MTKLEEVARAIADIAAAGECSDDGVFMKAARAAVEALRKPTKQMLYEGNRVTTDGRGADESWPAMVDAILSEKR